MPFADSDLPQALRLEEARAQEKHAKELLAKQQLERQMQERMDLSRVARVRRPSWANSCGSSIVWA